MPSLIIEHCRFLVPGNTQEILTKIWHHFWLKLMMKSGLEKFILKFHGGLQRYLLTCQANSAFLGRFFLHWAVSTLKGLGEFQNKKIYAFKAKNVNFKTRDFCPLIEWVLDGVYYPLPRTQVILVRGRP